MSPSLHFPTKYCSHGCLIFFLSGWDLVEVDARCCCFRFVDATFWRRVAIWAASLSDSVVSFDDAVVFPPGC